MRQLTIVRKQLRRLITRKTITERALSWRQSCFASMRAVGVWQRIDVKEETECTSQTTVER